MKLGEHMARSLFVAWSFLTGDTKQLKFLEMSDKGVVRSFTALSFAAPMFFLINWLQFQAPGYEWVNIVHIALLFLGYAAGWVGFAAIARFAYSTVGPPENFLIYMPLYNWARVYVLLLVLPFFTLSGIGLITGTLKDVVFALTILFVILYKLRITRATLLMPAFPSVLFVLFDMTLLVLADALVFAWIMPASNPPV